MIGEILATQTTIAYAFPLLMIFLGITCLLYRDNLVKKVIGLGVFSNGIHLLLITIGFRGSLGSAVPPILDQANPAALLAYGVDPLPQALVLTSIVINTAVIAFALFAGIRAHQLFGTLRPKEWDT